MDHHHSHGNETETETNDTAPVDDGCLKPEHSPNGGMGEFGNGDCKSDCDCAGARHCHDGKCQDPEATMLIE